MRVAAGRLDDAAVEGAGRGRIRNSPVKSGIPDPALTGFDLMINSSIVDAGGSRGAGDRVYVVSQWNSVPVCGA
jgi:hypothetical protein